MNALKKLLMTKGIAAAFIAGAGVAAPAISHATPDDGMICRAGYSAQFSGGTMRCTKPVVRHISLVCANPVFPIKRVRVAGIPNDTTGGRDICLRNNGVQVSSNSPLTGLTAGQDFVFVTVDQTRAVAAREAVETSEEGALNLGTGGVDSRSVSTLAINGGVGAEDNVKIDITLFTFPVAAPTLLKAPILIDRPVIDLLPVVRALP